MMSYNEVETMKVRKCYTSFLYFDYWDGFLGVTWNLSS